MKSVLIALGAATLSLVSASPAAVPRQNDHSFMGTNLYFLQGLSDAAQDAYKGKLKVVGAPFSEERYGIGLKKGDTDLCEQVNDALTKMVDDGAWDKAVEDNFGPAGFEVDEKTNPPEHDTCS